MKHVKRILLSLLLGTAAAGLGAPAQAMQPTKSAPPRATTDHARYLSGELLRWQDDRLVTTVGTYTIGVAVQLENRMPEVRSGFEAEKDKPAPKVQLKFINDRLSRVVIYP